MAIVIWIVGAAVGFAILYAVIRAAILSALREHTKTSATAVIANTPVPVRLVESPPA